MKYLKIFACLFVLAYANPTIAQFAWIEPAIPDLEDSVTIYVDLTLDPDCASLVGNAGPLYLWSWMPAEPVIGNGDWGASNTDLAMTDEGNDVWSITFIPTEFYGVPAQDFYDNGISLLVKAQNGGAGGDCGVGGGENKTSDITLTIEAPFAPEPKVKSFPSLSKTGPLQEDYLLSARDDVFTLIYNNAAEEKVTMQDADELFVYTRLIGTDGNNYNYVALSQVGNTPELQMTNVGDGIFHFTLIPDEFFASVLPAGVQVQTMRYQIIKWPLCSSDCAVDGEYLFEFYCE